MDKNKIISSISAFILGVCACRCYEKTVDIMKRRKIKQKLDKQALERLIKCQEAVLKYNQIYEKELKENIQKEDPIVSEVLSKGW